MTEGSEQSAAMRERSYLCGCDCGAVLYEVELGRRSARTQSVWERVVPARSFRLLRGEECLSGHQFADQPVHHFFCDRCGVRVFSRCAAHAGVHYAFDLKSLRASGWAEADDRGAAWATPRGTG